MKPHEDEGVGGHGLRSWAEGHLIGHVVSERRAIASTLESDLIDLLVIGRECADHPNAALAGSSLPLGFVPAPLTLAWSYCRPDFHRPHGPREVVPAIPKHAIGQQSAGIDST